MAIHLTSLNKSPFTAPPARTPHGTAHAAARATQQARSPERGAQPNTRALTATASTSSPTTAAVDPAEAFKALFSGASSNTAVAPTSSPEPTAQSVFGPNPWVDNPTGVGPDGTVYGYNQQYFATQQTAAAVAQMLGGKVVQVNQFTNAPGSTFQQQQPNEMVQLKNGVLINPGLVAGFYTHGYSQSMVDQMIANEVTNTVA